MVKPLTKIILGAALCIMLFFIGIFSLLTSPDWSAQRFDTLTLTAVTGIVMMVLGIIAVFAVIVYGLYKLKK
ncbi:MAG: hypothetical protein A7316_06605 [Candidatus Altiarchaeales archaeon WOR_SM1_86-2]|nr:MAG: hypothetical protein A7315_13180 [Candidatus Altiarchaeales archaeon WOR_SM1_79]ODS38961.1 MAG: hypothetical protein A7316_06605 [Candidatus Altiarchaeales archaeon WOR_SM1_86-2]